MKRKSKLKEMRKVFPFNKIVLFYLKRSLASFAYFLICQIGKNWQVINLAKFHAATIEVSKDKLTLNFAGE